MTSNGAGTPTDPKLYSPAAEMLRIWNTGVEEVRDLIEHGWSRA